MILKKGNASRVWRRPTRETEMGKKYRPTDGVMSTKGGAYEKVE